MAQEVEHWATDPNVQGSNPTKKDFMTTSQVNFAGCLNHAQRRSVQVDPKKVTQCPTYRVLSKL